MKTKTIKIFKRATRLLPVLPLLGVLAFAACTDSMEGNIAPNDHSASDVTITVAIPGAQTPTTRSIAGEKGEAVVGGIDILVFAPSAADGASDVLIQHVEGMNIMANNTDEVNEHYEVTFLARLATNISASSLVILANVPPATITKITGLTDKIAILKALTHVTPKGQKWKATSTTDYTPIPMYGEHKITTGGVKAGMKIEGIKLIRMLARIDVENKATGFILNKVHLVNYNLAGYIAPAWDTNGSKLSTLPSAPMIPSVDNPRTNLSEAMAYTYPTSEQGMFGEIYTYEAVAATRPGQADAVCLILEGKFNGETYFYRVDFTTNPTDRSEVNYMPLWRNHRYEVKITKVDGRGYESIKAAFEASGIMNNLKTQLLVLNEGDMGYSVFNGQYYLGFESETVTLGAETGSTLEVKCKTNYEGGWKLGEIEYVEGMSGWLEVRKDDQGLLQLKTTDDNILNTEKLARVPITAGRLTGTLIVKQSGASLNLAYSVSEVSKTGGSKMVTIESLSNTKLRWAVNSITTTSGIRGIHTLENHTLENHTLENHKAFVTKTDGTALTEKIDYMPIAERTFRVVFPKVYFPNRELPDITAEIEIGLYTYNDSNSSYEPTGVTKKMIVGQESLISQGLNIWNAHEQTGSLTYTHDWSLKAYAKYLKPKADKWQDDNAKNSPIPSEYTYVHLGNQYFNKKFFDWGVYATFSNNKDGIMMITSEMEDSTFPGRTVNVYFGLMGIKYEATKGDGVNEDASRVPSAMYASRIGKFLTTYGEFPITEAIEPFETDNSRMKLSDWPETAVKVMGKIEGHATMTIDPVNKLVFLGEDQVFADPANLDSNRGLFMKNFAAYVVNAAKYGSHFTDMLRDDILNGFNAPPAPWEDVWGANKWPGYKD